MSRIATAFERARGEGRAALVVYVCAGDPDLATTVRVVVAAAEAGADVIELGVPFSDPTADGVAIQRASERSLRAGTTLTKVLACVREVRAANEVPIVLFGYYNPILSYGEARFARDAAAAGADGALVVDLPPEEAEPLLGPLRDAGLGFVPLLAPTSTDARIARAASVASSFLYYVSMTGVTGASAPDLAGAAARAAVIARTTGRPVAVGFGVATPADVAVVAREADGVVVGSAVVRAIADAASPDAAVEAVRALVASLAAATPRAKLQ